MPEHGERKGPLHGFPSHSAREASRRDDATHNGHGHGQHLAKFLTKVHHIQKCIYRIGIFNFTHYFEL